jgi:meiotic recombination protein REC8
MRLHPSRHANNARQHDFEAEDHSRKRTRSYSRPDKVSDPCWNIIGVDQILTNPRPSNLILPYDPAFLPETGLPGLDIDLSILDGAFEDPSTQLSGLWLKSPNNSSSGVSPMGSLQIEMPSDDMLGEGTLIGLDDIYGSGQKKGVFGQITGLGLGNEEGDLLQADFEFDEDGNLVELGSPKPGRKSSVDPLGGHGRGQGQGWDGDQVSIALWA